MIDDFKLIQEILKGNHNLFESLVHRYQRQVANLIFLTMGNSDDVEDIAQEVFIRVFNALPKFKFDASVYSWIHRITVNLCIDEIRKRKVRKVLSLDFITEDALDKLKKNKEQMIPFDAMMKEERTTVVQKALQKISPEHREILVLREYRDFSYQEIAETLKLSIEAVKSRIFRARQDLKKHLSPYFMERT